MERFALFIALPLLMTGCGRKGALMYPDMLVPEAPTIIDARQSGTAVRLEFALPEKNRVGGVMPPISGVRISKRARNTDHESFCRSCTTGYQLFQRIYSDALPPSVQRNGKQLVVIDEEVTSGFTYSYNLVPFMADGVEGAAAEIGEMPVVPSRAAPVVTLELTPTEISLHVTTLPSSAETVVGFNLYRSTADQSRSSLPLNKEPCTGGEYHDTAVERGMTYRYVVRMVFRGKDGHLVESLPSPEVRGTLKEDND